MANIQIFNNPQFGEIRTAGTQDEPLFCLADVCKALDLKAAAVKRRLDSSVTSSHPVDTGFGIKEMNFITEDGLYDVILDSRKPEAKAFRKWMTSEVIPSIRKNGGYIAATAEGTPELIMAKALKLADATIQRIQEQNRLLSRLNAEKDRRIEDMAPKAEYCEEVLSSRTTYTLTQIAKELNFSTVEKFTKDLNKRGIIYKQSGQWLPYAPYAGKGYFSNRTFQFPKWDGTIGTSVFTVMTEAGRMWLHTSVYNC